MEIVAVDIGGTHARFAIARAAPGDVRVCSEPVKLSTSAYSGLAAAWEEFRRRSTSPLPRHAGIAIATPISGDELRMTNNSWIIHVPELAAQLQIDSFRLVNDFEAMAYAVSTVTEAELAHIAGPVGPLPAKGVTTIIGPGTGLGVAQLVRTGTLQLVLATEGGHFAYAPVDEFESELLRRLQLHLERVSVERVVSGPGLTAIYETVAALRGMPAAALDSAELWSRALAGNDPLVTEALQRFCRSFGSVAGDAALVQGAKSVVIGGGVGQLLQPVLPKSEFHSRFVAKGRFRELMERIPIKLITHPEPGLLGAAAAFAAGR
jgi:glucokinase